MGRGKGVGWEKDGGLGRNDPGKMFWVVRGCGEGENFRGGLMRYEYGTLRSNNTRQQVYFLRNSGGEYAGCRKILGRRGIYGMARH